MSGEELNPQISQMDTDDPVVGSTAQPTTQTDANLVEGFGKLVQRVAHLETLMQGLMRDDRQTSELPRPSGRLAAVPRDGDFISPVAMSPAAPPSDARSAAVTDRPAEANITQDSASTLVGRVWQDAPLPLRLRFVRDLLSPEHPLQPVLKEATGLEEVRGRELETWLTGYPSLFADAMERLETQPVSGPGNPELLAVATLQEVRDGLKVTLDELGIEWIRPVAGAMIGEEHEVIGEMEAPVPAGRVASSRRRGFRQRGKLVLPAQVMRATGNRPASWVKAGENPPLAWINTDLPVAGVQAFRHSGVQEKASSGLNTRTPEHPTPNTQHPVSNLDPWPNWLRTFQQRSTGCELTIVKQLLAVMRELAQTAAACAAGGRSEAELVARLEPLLPLLGARYVPGLLALPAEWGEVVTEMRDGLLAWLRDALGIAVIAPEPGALCDADTMQVTGVRRTAHAHEDGTVAKVERIGLRRGERVLFRAQVLRYELGAGDE